MAQELLRDVLRPGDSARTRRRMWLLPLSIAAHAAAIGALIIIPLGAEVGLPTPASVIRMVQVATPEPPPVPVIPPAGRRVEAVNRAVAPTQAPDRIEPEPPPVPTRVSEFGVPMGSALAAGATELGTAVMPVAPVAPPLPAQPTPSIVRPGGLIREPRRVVNVTPEYPAIARAARVEGTVILEAVLDERGSVDQVRVLRSDSPLLNDAAARAVQQWRYTPTLLNGVPVKVLMTITVTFRLN